MDVERLIQGYISLRDKKAALESKHKEELKPVKDLMQQFEERMLSVMNETGTTSLKTSSGTAYQTRRASATVADREAFRNYIEANDMWELADIRASKTAIRALLEETGDLPDGINWRESFAVNFKR